MKKHFYQAALRTGSSLSIAALAFAGATQAWAQDAVPAEDSGESIIVTGSRIKTPPQFSSANPIVAITSETIDNSGLTNLSALLAQSPALFNSETNYDAAGSQARSGGVGVNLLDLRNLGSNRTLVLVNGRRHIAGIPGVAGVDINTIPVALTERVDILTGGASAIYGADGVSGVVNFITKRDFEGIDARAQKGISTYGDAPNTYLSLTAGKNFSEGRGNIAVSYEYRQDGRVKFTDRAFGEPDAVRFVRNPNDIPDKPDVPDYVPLRNIRYFGSSPGGSVFVTLAPIFDSSTPPDFRGDGGLYNAGQYLPQSNGLGIGGDDTPIAGYQGDLQAALKTHNLNILTSYELTPSIKFYAEGKYVRTKAFSVAQPSFDFFTYVPADNPFIPQSIRDAIAPGNFSLFGLPDGLLFNRDNFDLGTRAERRDTKIYRGVMGFEGEISSHARFDVSYVFGRNDTTYISENYRLEDRYFAALDAVDEGQFLTGTPNGVIRCRVDLTGGAIDPVNYGNVAQTFTPGAGSGCSPLNLFGEGAASAAALDFINVDLRNRYKLTQHVVNGYISGDFGQFFTLPGGPISFALGGEYRKEISKSSPDPISTQTVVGDPESGVLADLALLANETGKFDVWEAFAELRAPILSQMPFAHRLEVGAAIRLSDYSTVGRTTTWKVDGVYAPIREVTFRGSYSKAVRAPNITELFRPRTGAFSFLSDPCSPVNITDGPNPTNRAANCRALIEGLGVDFDTFDFDSSSESSASILGRAAGNPNLTEESAKTWTAGVVLQPMRNLTLSVDWYDIRIKSAINTASLQQTAEFCVDAPDLDNVFCSNITRDPATGYIVNYNLSPENVAFFETAGADISLAYVQQTARAGTFTLQGTLGYLDKLRFLPANGGVVNNDRGEPGSPKWVGSADLTWTLDRFTVNYGINYIGKTLRYEIDTFATDPDYVDAKYKYIDAVFTHDIRLAMKTEDKDFTFYVGVNNFTNEMPAFGSSNTPVSFLGRYFYAGVNLNM